MHNKKKIFEIIEDRSGYLFLYLRFLRDILNSKYSSGSLHLSDVENEDVFPIGLEGVYTDYFGRLKYENLAQGNLYSKVLSPLVAARAPLPLHIWQQTCGFEQNELDAFKVIIESTKNLLYISENNNEVRFLHKSMAEWLTDKEKSGRELYVKVKEGHKLLAQFAAKKIGDSGISADLHPFVVENCIYHFCKSRSKTMNRMVHDKMTDFEWILTFLSRMQPDTLVYDINSFYRNLKTDRQVEAIINSVEMGAEAIKNDPRELASQLVGRIENYNYQHSSSVAVSHPWLRPLNYGILTPALSPLRRIIAVDGVTCVAIDAENDIVVLLYILNYMLVPN